MKLATILFLMAALFTTTVLAEGNMGTGGRGTNGDVRTNTVKGGFSTEDGDPPPSNPPCVPSSTEPCDGNMGTGGRPASADILLFVQQYLIAIFG